MAGIAGAAIWQYSMPKQTSVQLIPPAQLTQIDGTHFWAVNPGKNPNPNSVSIDSNGLFNNVDDDINMLTTATDTAKKWEPDAVADVVIMISGDRLKNVHIVYFSSQNHPEINYYVGLDLNDKIIPELIGEEKNDMQTRFGNIGYIDINSLTISSVAAFHEAEAYAQGKTKKPISDYDKIFLLDYNKYLNANVWLYSLTNKIDLNDIFKITISASSGKILGVSKN